MQRMQQKRAGFTLIELMVVVAIIAILVTIGLATYRGAQAKAKDSRMMSAVRSYQAALEQKYRTSTSPASYEAWPSAADFSDGVDPSSTTPGPQLVGKSSVGGASTNFTGYCLRTFDALSDTSKANCTGCLAGVMTTGTNDRYCVTNLQ